jgi:hypothetical protein
MFWTADRMKEDIELPGMEEPKMNARRHQDNVNLDSKVNRFVAAPSFVVQRLLLACGVVGPVLFNVTYLIEGVSRPGYNSLILPISALEAGSLGWIQDANFIVFGLLIGCFAVGLRKAFIRGFGAVVVPLLEGFVMLGLIGDGIFTRDPLHTACDILTFTAAVATSLVCARRFAGDPRWRGWAAYSIATAILAVIFLILFGVAMTHNGPAGLFEKLATLIRSIWTFLLAIRLLIRPGSLLPQEETP